MKIQSLLAALSLSCCVSTLPGSPLTGLDHAGQLAPANGISNKPGSEFSYARLPDGIQICANGLRKNILFYGPNIVRVNANLGVPHTEQPSLTVIAKPASIAFEIKTSGTDLMLVSREIQIEVNKQTGALTFQRPDGSIITRENAQQPADIKEVTISNAPTYEVKQNFTLTPEESLYGLGQDEQKAFMDYRGQEMLLVQTNIGMVIPFLLSTNRYGIMWDVYSKSIFKDDANGASFWAESAPAGVDYYLIAGKDMDGVIAGYRNLTGAAPMYPKSAFGLWMSKERYKTQDRLIEVVKSFRNDGFPLDNIVQDWQYWGGDRDGTWSGMIWNKERFPNPMALTNTLHNELHVKLMNSIWPSVGNDTELAHDLDAKGLRFAPLHWISKKARIYDAFSPEGRAIYFKHIKKGLLDVGVDALWMDGTEVEVGGACHNPNEVERDIKSLGNTALGDFTRYLNVYSLETTKGTYEGQRATSNKRVLTLTRSAFVGQQRYAALPWSGDTTASWGTFKKQIMGGINVAMAGLPYWTQDTGGFFVPYHGGEQNPEFRELFARWNQFAIFNPIYRIHGTGAEREPYIFKTLDPAVYKSLLDAASLRYSLIPYIYGLAWQTTSAGYTMMRGLPMDFPDDLKGRKLEDEFMFGPAFLVHPVTSSQNAKVIPGDTIPAEVFQTPDGQPGIAVEYFEGTNFERSVSKLVDPKVDYTWPGPPLAEFPQGLKSGNNFSGRWTGSLIIPETGEYEMGAEGDDGVRLWLDGKLVVDDWSIHPMRWRSQKMNFSKGQKVAVKIEYYQGQGGRGLRLGWKTPTQLAAEAANQTDVNAVETYLPTGADWYDFWTNQRYQGGVAAKGHFPLDRFPLYVKAGSIVPFSPVMNYTTEKPDAPYEIRIYPGANARFVIYEDDNETYNYEKGQYATIELVWNDAARTLTIGKRTGAFPGMMAMRKFNVVVAAPEKNTGMEASPDAKVITYFGKQTALKF